MKSLTIDEFRKMREKDGKLTVINVLSQDNYREAHIPGTQNVPRGDDDFLEKVETLAGSKDQPVVVYCASTDCDASPKAAKTLENAGFNKVYDFEGGTKAWKEAGEKVIGSMQ